MKWIYRAFCVAGFIFQYVLPVLLFGRILPYTRQDIKKSLTVAGIAAICFLLLMLGKKVKEAVIRWDHGIKRGVALSIIEAVPVLLIALFLRWLVPAVNSILEFWYSIIPFFVIGRICYVIAEVLCEREAKS